jgi:hypothetical protein
MGISRPGRSDRGFFFGILWAKISENGGFGAAFPALLGFCIMTLWRDRRDKVLAGVCRMPPLFKFINDINYIYPCINVILKNERQ